MIDIKLLSNISNIKQFSTGSIIISEQDVKYDEMFILLVGKVVIVKDYQTPNQLILDTITPGNIFGEMSLFCQVPRSATVIAIEDATVASITRDNFFDFAAQNTEVVFQMMNTFCTRIINMNNELARVSAASGQPMQPIKVQGTKNNLDSSKESTAKPEKTTLKSATSSPKVPIVAPLLFPENHKNYAIERPEEYEQFIFKYNYTCSYCGKRFPGYIKQKSKLRPKGDLSCDLRRIYHDFEPIWYDIVTCPHCYFSTLESFYMSDKQLDKSLIKQELKSLKENAVIKFDEPRDINQVFASYYLALICAAAYDEKKQIESKLWLSLYRLYGDIGDKEMELYALDKAYSITKSYYDESNLSPEYEQVILMILGCLSHKKGNVNDAFFFLNKSRKLPDAKEAYKRIAEIELDDIREERHNQK